MNGLGHQLQSCHGENGNFFVSHKKESFEDSITACEGAGMKLATSTDKSKLYQCVKDLDEKFWIGYRYCKNTWSEIRSIDSDDECHLPNFITYQALSPTHSHSNSYGLTIRDDSLHGLESFFTYANLRKAYICEKPIPTPPPFRTTKTTTQLPTNLFPTTKQTSSETSTFPIQYSILTVVIPILLLLVLAFICLRFTKRGKKWRQRRMKKSTSNTNVNIQEFSFATQKRKQVISSQTNHSHTSQIPPIYQQDGFTDGENPYDVISTNNEERRIVYTMADDDEVSQSSNIYQSCDDFQHPQENHEKNDPEDPQQMYAQVNKKNKDQKSEDTQQMYAQVNKKNKDQKSEDPQQVYAQVNKNNKDQKSEDPQQVYAQVNKNNKDSNKESSDTSNCLYASVNKNK